jgi:hypothetical protein
MKRITVLIFILLGTLATACGLIPGAATPLPPNVLVYDAPITLTIKKDSLLPGTTLAYNGKSETGAARLMIAGQLAPKQVADNVEWQGSPVPNIALKLATRVATFDDNAITLLGTAHVEIKDVKPQPGGVPGTTLIEFGPFVTYSLAKNEFVPGTNLAYVGSSDNGAQFIGVEGIPYRKTGDSIQYNGRLAPKIFLRLDLRLIRFTDADAQVGGQAKIIIEQ